MHAVRPLIKWTYLWMFVGLLITSAIAAFTDTTTSDSRKSGDSDRRVHR